MKVTIELDDSQPTSGNAAIALIGRIFGMTAATAPLASSTSTASPPPPAGAPIPVAVGAPPAVVPMTAPPPAAPASVAPPMASPPAAVAPVPMAPPAPASGGITLAQFASQVQAFATAYGAKATKARFGELAAAFQQPGWTSNSTIPADKYAEVLPWFQVAAA